MCISRRVWEGYVWVSVYGLGERAWMNMGEGVKGVEVTEGEEGERRAKLLTIIG